MFQGKPYSIVVLCASFFALFLGPSVSYATGVFHVALLEQFQADLTLTAWIGSIFMSMFAFMGPVASLMINMFDCRTSVVLGGLLCMIGFTASFFVTNIYFLFLTYALIAGLGTGLIQGGATIILGYYFPKNTALASGICVTGAGLGMFVHPALVEYLIRRYGLHGAFLLTGGLMMNTCVCGMLMRPSSFERKRQQTVLKGHSLGSKICLSLCGDLSSFLDVAKNMSFLMFALSCLLLSMAIAIIYLFLPDYFITKGATFQGASFAVSASGIGSIISRLLTGIASSDEAVGTFSIFTSISGLIGIITLFVPYLSTTSYSRIIYGLLLGLYTGGEWVIVNIITLEILGLKYFATGLGVVSFASGAGGLMGPPIAGAVFESSGEFYHVFLLCVSLFFLTTVCGYISILNRKEKPITEKTPEKTLPIGISTGTLNLKDPAELHVLMEPPIEIERDYIIERMN